MVADIRVVGLGGLERVARELKAAGNEGLKKELRAGLRAATDPLKPKIRASAAAALPHRGGLAALVARSPMSVRTGLGSNPSVRLVMSNKHDIKRMNAGTVRHPLFGNRQHWYTQAVTPGWFERPVQADLPQVRDAVNKAIQRTLDNIK